MWNLDNDPKIKGMVIIYLYYKEYSKECHMEDAEEVSYHVSIAEKEVYEHFKMNVPREYRNMKSFRETISLSGDFIWNSLDSFKMGFEEWISARNAIDLDSL